MEKHEIYTEITAQITAINAGETNETARLATAACVLHHAFESFFWTGFYLVDPEKSTELVVGPYQGTLGCLRIPIGKGVCGTCAQKQETVIVKDVHEFPGHIACDSRSNSEIVVPVIDKAGNLRAVLDIDSTQFANFDEIDAKALENICAELLA